MPKIISAAIVVAAALAALPAFAAPDVQPAPPVAKSSKPGTGVMRYDTNGDGVVDRAEWDSGQEARFQQLDTNKDGKLSQDEMFARSPASGGNVLPSDRQTERQTAYFRRVDTDKDGAVSKTEFMSQANRNFARCDTNKDGRIDTAECRQALRRPPSATQPANSQR